MAIFNVNISETFTVSDTLNRVRNLADLGIVPKQVRALLLNQLDDRTGIRISWLPLEQNAATYEVFRVGAVVQSDIASEPMPISAGDTLTFKVRGGVEQTITFSAIFITDGAATVAEVVANINAFITDAVANESEHPLVSNLYLRPTKFDKQASLQITGGTANAILNFSTGLFTANIRRSSSQLLGTITHPTVTFDDVDGTNTDHYFVRALNSLGLEGQDSVLKSLERYFDDVPSRTVIYGFIYDSGGNPSEGKPVTLRPALDTFPSLDKGLNNSAFGIVFDEHTVNTDADGYFELEAIAGTDLRLTIDSIKYDFIVQVPSTPIEFTKLSLVIDDFRISTTTGLISRPGLLPDQSELVIGEVKIINASDCPIPVIPGPGAVFEVQVSNFPVGIVDAATNTKLDELIAIFNGGTDLGDVTILNTVTVTPSGGTMPISGDVGFSENFLPLSDGNNWFAQEDSTAILTLSFVQYSFGFTSIGFAIWSDEDPTAPGAKDIQFSWDGINIAGTLKPNEAIGRDNVRQTSIYLRSVAAGALYRLEVWG